MKKAKQAAKAPVARTSPASGDKAPASASVAAPQAEKVAAPAPAAVTPAPQQVEAKAQPAAAEKKAPVKRSTPAKKPVASKPAAKPADVKAVEAPAAAAAPVAVEAAAPAQAEVAKKKKKAKVVRDSFTMPETDYAKIAELKKKGLEAGVSIKKSELLRAGLHALEALPIAQLKALLESLEDVKTGRPAAEAKPDAAPAPASRKRSK